MARRRSRRSQEESAIAALKRQHRVADLYLAGKTQWEIADLVGITQGTVSKDLAAIRTAWLASAVRDFDAIKSEQLAKIDRVEVIAWAAWERSCKDAETRRVESISGRTVRVTEKTGKHTTKTTTEKLPPLEKASKSSVGQSGDPRFLDRIAWCVETRLKLIGALPRGELPLTPDGGALVVKVIGGAAASMEDL